MARSIEKYPPSGNHQGKADGNQENRKLDGLEGRPFVNKNQDTSHT